VAIALNVFIVCPTFLGNKFYDDNIKNYFIFSTKFEEKVLESIVLCVLSAFGGECNHNLLFGGCTKAHLRRNYHNKEIF